MDWAKLYLGPVSKNVIDAAIEYAEEYDESLGLIASRRQIDWHGGYVGFGTEDWAKYVRGLSSRIILCRDHGGPGQGEKEDFGYDSFAIDAANLDLIHIDPFKFYGWKEAKEKTAEYIKFCYKICPTIYFEIGTEQAIFEYGAEQLDELLNYLEADLTFWEWNRIKYAVIQSGTGLQDGKNIGEYSQDRLKEMLGVVREYGMRSKLHNGDFLSLELVERQFNLCLDAINVAPELGSIETEVLLNYMDEEQQDLFFNLCFKSGKWKKWTQNEKDRETILKVSGHYVFNNPEFQLIKDELDATINEKIKDKIKEKIAEICNCGDL